MEISNVPPPKSYTAILHTRKKGQRRCGSLPPGLGVFSKHKVFLLTVVREVVISGMGCVIGEDVSEENRVMFVLSACLVVCGVVSMETGMGEGVVRGGGRPALSSSSPEKSCMR